MTADDPAPDVPALCDALNRRIDAISGIHDAGMLLLWADAALLIAVARSWRSMVQADKRPFGATPGERQDNDVA